VAEAALYCAHRTSTVSSCAFCEQEGHLAPPLLAVFFSILLLRKRELGKLSLLETLLHQRANIEHPFDLLNVIESGFRAGVRRGEE
jgi:hypothetical protein